MIRAVVALIAVYGRCVASTTDLKDFLVYTSRSSNDAIVVREDAKCENLTDWFIRSASPTSTKIIIVDENDLDVAVTDATRVVVFADDDRDLSTVFVNLATAPFFRTYCEFVFVLCDEVVQDDELLARIFDELWDKRVIKFVLVYRRRDGDDVQVVSYSPYAEGSKLLNFSGAQKYGPLFPQKLNNLHGYAVNAVIFDVITGKSVDSTHADERMLFTLIESLNGTINMTHLAGNQGQSTKAIMLIASGEVEFCPIMVPMLFSLTPSLEFSYPNTYNDIVVLVPRPRLATSWKYILALLTKKIFLSSIAMMVAMTALDFALFNNRNVIDTLLMYYGSFMTMPFKEFDRRKSPIAFGWFAYVIVVGAALRSMMMTDILTPQYENPIETIDDLDASGLAIYSMIDAQIFPEPLRDQLVIVDGKQLGDSVLAQVPGASFVVPESFAKKFFTYHRDQRKEFPYEIMPEPVMPTFGGFIFRRNSPFLGNFQRIYLLSAQSGDVDNDHTVDKFKAQFAEVKVVFTVRHLAGQFALLVVGWLVSFVTLLIELGISKKTAPNKHQ